MQSHSHVFRFRPHSRFTFNANFKHGALITRKSYLCGYNNPGKSFLKNMILVSTLKCVLPFINSYVIERGRSTVFPNTGKRRGT